MSSDLLTTISAGTRSARKRRRGARLSLAVKRMFDVTLSAIILILLSPLLVGIVIAIKIGSRGPVLFTSQAWGKTDGYPQLLNVVRGEMSLVGPRLALAKDVEHYDLNYLRRFEVLPGLTGLWLVNARQDSSFEAYMALDTLYIETRSFWLDMKILVKTIGGAFAGTGS